MFLFGKKASFARICADIVSDADEAVILLGQNREILFCNRGANHMLGYAMRDLVGEHFDFLIPERFQKEYKSLLHNQAIPFHADTAEPIKPRQVYMRRQNGQECAASISVFRTGIPKVKYAVVLRDISQSQQTEDELVKFVMTDTLTRVYNARTFLTIGEREAARASRYNRPLTLMMLDLDQFKKLNEIYGYPAGDKVLQRVATLCQNMLRKVDVFARWNGEEFIAILPETDIEGGGIIAERLRKAVYGNMLSINNYNIKFTVSIGLTSLRHAESTLDEPIKRVQEAVQAAKRDGFNCIKIMR